MRRNSRTLLCVVIAALAVTAAGCGSARTTPEVQLSITAPTDGATVIVSRITLVGTVAPKDAELLVAGKRVRVVSGAFRKPLVLRKGLTRIRVKARAKGFAGTEMTLSVRYSPAPTAQPQPLSSPAPAVPSDSTNEAISTCSAASGGASNLCVCVFNRLAKAGFNTEAKWQALVEDWRRSFLARGVITYPPVMKQAIIGCAEQFGAR